MRTRHPGAWAVLALALALLAAAPAGCARPGGPAATRIVIYDHGQATVVAPGSREFAAIGEQAAALVGHARTEIAALAFPWERAARCTQEQVAVEVVFPGPGVQAGIHGPYTSALIPLDEDHEPGRVHVYLGRERYELLVPAEADAQLAALCALAGVPVPPVQTGPLPPTVAAALPTATAEPATATPDPCPPRPTFTPGPLTWRRVQDAWWGYSFEVPTGWLETEHATPDRLIFYSDPGVYGRPEFCPLPNGLIKLDFGADPPRKGPDLSEYTATTIAGRPAWIFEGSGGEAMAADSWVTSVYILGPEFGYLLWFGCTPPPGGSPEENRDGCRAVVDHVLASFQVTP